MLSNIIQLYNSVCVLFKILFNIYITILFQILLDITFRI